MQFKEVCGFKFVKVGEAYLCDEPLQNKNGTPVIVRGKEFKDWRLKLKLVVNEKILDAGQSVYLVFKNSDLLYVGCFSNSFRQKWTKRGYIWHRKDMIINKLVKENNDISVWLSVNPYAGEFNITELIKDEIIIKYIDNGVLLNAARKNQKEYRKDTFPVRNILDIKDN